MVYHIFQVISSNSFVATNNYDLNLEAHLFNYSWAYLRIARWLGTTSGSHENGFSPATTWMNCLSVAYDYDIIIDGGKPTCFDSTCPCARAAAPPSSFIL